jgi:putative hemolysin
MYDSDTHNRRGQFDLGDLSAGSLHVVLAERVEDVKAAQALRYRVFVEEMGARTTREFTEARREWDAFDSKCDHLLVVDHRQLGRDAQVVGTYRILRRSMMAPNDKFYSEDEFDLSAIRSCPHEIAEFGRSCVDPAYRNRAVMSLLWRAIGAYVAKSDIRLMFGCASFLGADPRVHAIALSYLHHFFLAPAELQPVATADRFIAMNTVVKESIDTKRAFALLPALIKGYLRLNGSVGLGAVVDQSCNTTDVCIVLDADRVPWRYVRRFGQLAGGTDQHPR